MNMKSTAWNALYNAVHATPERRPFSRVTLSRIVGFARPQRRHLGAFLMISVMTSVLAVATPLLAGRIIDAITRHSDPMIVARLAGLVALIALAEAAFGLLSRWLSARIGETLILHLRTTVFDHVQRMPVALFTRTRTGALVSRLNNDVIGAQRAFSNTLSGVAGNLVTLTLTLVVMIETSWQVTLLALCLLPCSRCPRGGWAPDWPGSAERQPMSTRRWATR